MVCRNVSRTNIERRRTILSFSNRYVYLLAPEQNSLCCGSALYERGEQSLRCCKKEEFKLLGYQSGSPLCPFETSSISEVQTSPVSCYLDFSTETPTCTVLWTRHLGRWKSVSNDT